MMLYLSTILISSFLVGSLFDHPSPLAAGFKFQPPAQDAWYYEDMAGMPDKFEHYTASYVGYRLLEKRLSPDVCIIVLGTVGVLKEMADGFREGFSVRDMAANLLGILAARQRLRLICYYENQVIGLRYYFQV